MRNTQTSPDSSEKLTQHAMLVVWGLYAQQIGLVKAIEQVQLRQKRRTHQPQTKVLEFLVAILAGLPHLKDISRSAHPLDHRLQVKGLRQLSKAIIQTQMSRFFVFV